MEFFKTENAVVLKPFSNFSQKRVKHPSRHWKNNRPHFCSISLLISNIATNITISFKYSHLYHILAPLLKNYHPYHILLSFSNITNPIKHYKSYQLFSFLTNIAMPITYCPLQQILPPVLVLSEIVKTLLQLRVLSWIYGWEHY